MMLEFRIPDMVSEMFHQLHLPSEEDILNIVTEEFQSWSLEGVLGRPHI